MSALATILLIVSVLGGGAGTVYASQSSMPDELLYPIKTMSEDVRLSLSDDDNQQELLDEFTDRRIEEISSMIEEGETTPDQVMDRLQIHLEESAILLAAEEDDEDLESSLLKLQDRLQTHEQIMDQLHINDPDAERQADQVQEMLQNQLQVCEDGLEDPLAFRLRYSNPNEDVPDNVPGAGNATSEVEDPDDGDDGDGEEPTAEATPDDTTEQLSVESTQASADKSNADASEAESTDTETNGNGNGNGDGSGQGQQIQATAQPEDTSETDSSVAPTVCVSTPVGSQSQGSGNGNGQGNNNVSTDDAEEDSGSDDSGSGGNGGGGGGGGGNGGKGK